MASLLLLGSLHVSQSISHIDVCSGNSFVMHIVLDGHVMTAFTNKTACWKARHRRWQGYAVPPNLWYILVDAIMHHVTDIPGGYCYDAAELTPRNKFSFQTCNTYNMMLTEEYVESTMSQILPAADCLSSPFVVLINTVLCSMSHSMRCRLLPQHRLQLVLLPAT